MSFYSSQPIRTRVLLPQSTDDIYTNDVRKKIVQTLDTTTTSRNPAVSDSSIDNTTTIINHETKDEIVTPSAVVTGTKYILPPISDLWDGASVDTTTTTASSSSSSSTLLNPHTISVPPLLPPPTDSSTSSSTTPFSSSVSVAPVHVGISSPSKILPLWTTTTSTATSNNTDSSNSLSFVKDSLTTEAKDYNEDMHPEPDSEEELNHQQQQYHQQQIHTEGYNAVLEAYSPDNTSKDDNNDNEQTKEEKKKTKQNRAQQWLQQRAQEGLAIMGNTLRRRSLETGKSLVKPYLSPLSLLSSSSSNSNTAVPTFTNSRFINELNILSSSSSSSSSSLLSSTVTTNVENTSVSPTSETPSVTVKDTSDNSTSNTTNTNNTNNNEDVLLSLLRQVRMEVGGDTPDTTVPMMDAPSKTVTVTTIPPSTTTTTGTTNIHQLTRSMVPPLLVSSSSSSSINRSNFASSNVISLPSHRPPPIPLMVAAEISNVVTGATTLPSSFSSSSSPSPSPPSTSLPSLKYSPPTTTNMMDEPLPRQPLGLAFMSTATEQDDNHGDEEEEVYGNEEYTLSSSSSLVPTGKLTTSSVFQTRAQQVQADALRSNSGHSNNRRGVPTSTSPLLSPISKRLLQHQKNRTAKDGKGIPSKYTQRAPPPPPPPSSVPVSAIPTVVSRRDQATEEDYADDNTAMSITPRRQSLSTTTDQTTVRDEPSSILYATTAVPIASSPPPSSSSSSSSSSYSSPSVRVENKSTGTKRSSSPRTYSSLQGYRTIEANPTITATSPTTVFSASSSSADDAADDKDRNLEIAVLGVGRASLRRIQQRNSPSPTKQEGEPLPTTLSSTSASLRNNIPKRAPPRIPGTMGNTIPSMKPLKETVSSSSPIHNENSTTNSSFYPPGFEPRLVPMIPLVPLPSSMVTPYPYTVDKIRSLWSSSGDPFPSLADLQKGPVPPLMLAPFMNDDEDNDNDGTMDVLSKPLALFTQHPNTPFSTLPSTVSSSSRAPPFSSPSLAVAAGTATPEELAVWLELYEHSLTSLRQDLRYVTNALSSASHEFDPRVQESEMDGYIDDAYFTSTNNGGNNSSGSISLLWQDTLKEAAEQALIEAQEAASKGDDIVESDVIAEAISSRAQELYTEMTRRTNTEAIYYENTITELRLFTPSVERVVNAANGLASHVKGSLFTLENQLKKHHRIEQCLTIQEEAIQKEIQILDEWEQLLNLPSIDVDENYRISHTAPYHTSLLSANEVLPPILAEQLTFIENEERAKLESEYQQKICELQADIEAQVLAAKVVGEERLTMLTKEEENSLQTNFDAEMALIQARTQTLQDKSASLATKITNINHQLSSHRQLRRLKANVRRLWATLQPEQLALVLDCDSEGWTTDEEAEAEELRLQEEMQQALVRKEQSRLDKLKEEEERLVKQKAEEEMLRKKNQTISPLIALGLTWNKEDHQRQINGGVGKNNRSSNGSTVTNNPTGKKKTVTINTVPRVSSIPEVDSLVLPENTNPSFTLRTASRSNENNSMTSPNSSHLRRSRSQGPLTGNVNSNGNTGSSTKGRIGSRLGSSSGTGGRSTSPGQRRVRILDSSLRSTSPGQRRVRILDSSPSTSPTRSRNVSPPNETKPRSSSSPLHHTSTPPTDNKLVTILVPSPTSLSSNNKDNNTLSFTTLLYKPTDSQSTGTNNTNYKVSLIDIGQKEALERRSIEKAEEEKVFEMEKYLAHRMNNNSTHEGYERFVSSSLPRRGSILTAENESIASMEANIAVKEAQIRLLRRQAAKGLKLLRKKAWKEQQAKESLAKRKAEEINKQSVSSTGNTNPSTEGSSTTVSVQPGVSVPLPPPPKLDDLIQQSLDEACALQPTKTTIVPTVTKKNNDTTVNNDGENNDDDENDPANHAYESIEDRTQRLQLRKRYRHTKDNNVRLRTALCAFLSNAIKLLPYDEHYIVVLKVALKVGQRLQQYFKDEERKAAENQQRKVAEEEEYSALGYERSHHSSSSTNPATTSQTIITRPPPGLSLMAVIQRLIQQQSSTKTLSGTKSSSMTSTASGVSSSPINENSTKKGSPMNDSKHTLTVPKAKEKSSSSSSFSSSTSSSLELLAETSLASMLDEEDEDALKNASATAATSSNTMVSTVKNTNSATEEDIDIAEDDEDLQRVLSTLKSKAKQIGQSMKQNITTKAMSGSVGPTVRLWLDSALPSL